MNNKSFSRAISLLTHPLSLFAILLLLINDHVLRVFWPSWVTGKLGDFAWLFFMPFAFAVIVALVIPPFVQNHTKKVGYLSFGTLGLLFFLGNSLPLTNTYMVVGLERIIPIQIQITRDPTDLLALSSCYVGWKFWTNNNFSIKSSRKKGVILVSISALLTIANMAAPDHGIQCFHIENHKIIVPTSHFEYYSSEDGGLSWAIENDEYDFRCDFSTSQETSQGRVVADPEDENQLYRMNAERKFEYSFDGGKSWAEVPLLEFLSQAEIAFIESTRGSTTWYLAGPFHVVKDIPTNNLVFAMGLEGVLVNTPQGEWELVPVGGYGLEKLTLPMVPILLFGEIALALELIMLTFCTLSWLTKRTWFGLIILLILWLAWGVVTIGLQPALNSGYGIVTQFYLQLFVAIIGLLLTYRQVINVRQFVSAQKVKEFAKISFVSACGFMIPYLLWAGNIIPSYLVSMILGLVLWLAVILSWFWQKKKQKEKSA